MLAVVNEPAAPEVTGPGVRGPNLLVSVVACPTPRGNLPARRDKAPAKVGICRGNHSLTRIGRIANPDLRA